MFKFVFCAANEYQKDLALPFSRTLALLSCPKNASPEPFAPHFRLQNQNLYKLLER